MQRPTTWKVLTIGAAMAGLQPHRSRSRIGAARAAGCFCGLPEHRAGHDPLPNQRQRSDLHRAYASARRLGLWPLLLAEPERR